MKPKYLILNVVIIIFFISGCTRLVFEIHQDVNPGGKVNIIIHTKAGTSDISITVDDAELEIEGPASLLKKKTMVTPMEHNDLLIYGTW